ncbi:MAG: FitA-like ribbon-helix-helix domain-containing protein [Opitutales bacterium]
MKSITLKNVPDGLHRAYRERAQRHARSLNREILQTLEMAASEERPDARAALARARQRVARQVARRRAEESRQLSTEDYLDGIREGRE